MQRHNAAVAKGAKTTNGQGPWMVLPGDVVIGRVFLGCFDFEGIFEGVLGCLGGE